MNNSCFWCPEPATKTLNGTPYCASHGSCSTCLKDLTTDALSCRCGAYGFAGHEEALYCSENCIEACHPPGEPSEGDMG